MTAKTYYTVSEIAEIIGCKTNTAYKIVAELNKQLKTKGYVTLQGKINKRYFHEHYLMPEDTKEA